MSDLPATWLSKRLGNLAEFVMGQAPPGSACNKVGTGTPFVKAGEFGDGRPIIREWTTRPLKLATANDVLICVVGATAGKINLGADCAIGRSVAAIQPGIALDQHFLYNFLATKVLELRAGSAGSAQGVISKDNLANVKVPLAPLPEQRRIVAKIDSLSAKSRRARDHLDHIRRLVEKYKQAILAAAFQGELTREWRKKNAERNVASLLKELASSRLSRRRSNMPTRSLVESDRLPDGWSIVRIEDVCSEVVDGTHHTPEYVRDGIPFISVKDIRNGEIDFSDCKYISSKEHEELSRRCNPVAGDLLVTKSGTIGRCAVVQSDDPAFSLFVSVALIRPATKNLRVKFLEHALNYWISTIDTGSEITGSTIKNLHLQDIKALGTPVPPTSEQDEVVLRIDRAFSWIDRLASEASSASKLIGHLDRAVLAKAFQGELVPQDPNDEPASALRERIGTERAAGASATKRPKLVQKRTTRGRQRK